MNVRDDVLAFLRNPQQFADSIDERSRRLWLAALDEIALPLGSSTGKRLGDVQAQAWRTLAPYRLGLVLGPPGTGKTFVLSWMAVAYLMARRRANLNCRVLLTGFTVNSIANLLEGVAQKALLFERTGVPVVFAGNLREQAFPAGVETFAINTEESQDAVWERLRQPHVIAGLTTWSLFRLISECKEERVDGPTLPHFDLVCIDEASQMMVAQGLMALGGMSPDCRVLVAGDNQQLPPVQAMFDREVNGRQLGSSLYEFLKTAAAPEVRFEETRRMNRPLAAFGNQEFYEDRFYPAADIANEELVLRDNWQEGLSDWLKVVLDPAYPVVIVLHDGPAAGVENAFERAIVKEIVQSFYGRMVPPEGQDVLTPEFFWHNRMAVITPHRAQNAALRSALAIQPWGVGCVVETVDRIQGKERDAIVAGYTVADTEFAQAEGEFLFSRNRLNVTTTRARRKLVFVVSRRLFEVVPPREEVIDAAQTMRRFVFGAERVEGSVNIRDGDGRSWPIELRVRRFESAALPPPLRAVLKPESSAELPEFTTALQELDRIIRKVALSSQWGNAPVYLIERECLRKIDFCELRDLLILGRVTLGRFGQRQFWAATPVDPPRAPLPVLTGTIQQRLRLVVEEIRQGRRAVPYWILRNRFVWVSPDGEDVLRPHIDACVREGMLQWVNETSLALVDEGEPSREHDLSPLPGLEDEDYLLLNLIEEHEKRRINFGIVESWSTLRTLGAELGWSQTRTAASAERLRAQEYILIGEDDRCRSRMAELARELRYVKQRFQVDDASKRPYLVRSLKVAIRDRNKPTRDRSLHALVERLRAEYSEDTHARAALAALDEMVSRAWSAERPLLAGFQERSIEMVFRAWTGCDQRSAYVVTADTGSGKTEAACLPLLAGAAWDRLRGIGGTRSVLVYPRIRLAHNQAQRLADYLAQFAAVSGAPHLTLGVQSTGVPPSYARVPEEWEARGSDFIFPFFDCPNSRCRKTLLLSPGTGTDGSDRLFCNACGWTFGGWVGTQQQMAASPPSFLLMVTESLHGWMQDPRYGKIFGDQRSAPRAVLADEIHLYALTHGANVGYAIRRLLARAQRNAADGRVPLAIGMSATLGRPDLIWGDLCGRNDVVQLSPSATERKLNPKGREYFYFVQPEVESRGKDIAGASTTIQSLMVLAHGMRRRTGKEGGFRGLVFLDSIDKVRRLHGDYFDAEEVKSLARLRTYLYGDDPGTGDPRSECCGDPWSCSRFRDGECWYFAANDQRQVTAAGPYRRNRHLAVGKWPVSSKGGEKTAEMMRQADIIFSTSSLEVGYDDPDMALVYQHYAPVNLASFVQRKGRGGRGADDRPVTGVTLSPYSPRDSWFFRRPEQMIDPSGFEIPLNMDNYFVRRGQAIAAMLDGVARHLAVHCGTPAVTKGDRTIALSSPAAESADRMVRAVMGDGIFEELNVSGIQELWTAAYAGRSSEIDFNMAPRYWGQKIPMTPLLLFQSINLPFLSLAAQGSERPELEDISLALAMIAPGNMTRRYSYTDFHWVVPRNGRHPWLHGEGAHSIEEDLFAGGDRNSFLREVPRAVQRSVGDDFYPLLSRPTHIRLELAGTRRGDWVPMWGFDRQGGAVVPLDDGQTNAKRIQEKSQGSLRSFLVVRADAQNGISQSWSAPKKFGEVCSFTSGVGIRPGPPGLRVSRLFWAGDATLKLDDRDNGEAILTQFFVHPGSQKPMFTGYSIETEGVQLKLDSGTLDRFVTAEAERIRGTEDERWLKGKLFGYLLRTNCASAGLNIYHAGRLAELLQTAAGREDLRLELRRLMRFWDSAAVTRLLQQTFEQALSYHPLLTAKRIESLGEAIATSSYREATQAAYRGSADEPTFQRYIRSLVLNGVAIRLHQMFVLHGRGDDTRVLFHSKTPLEYDSDASDTISVFENGTHGDGTTRTFLRGLEEVSAAWIAGALAECPSAQEDTIIERLAAESDSHPDWSALDPGSLPDMEKLANELGVDPSIAAFDRVIALRYGSELIGNERFELFRLHAEIRDVRQELRRQMRRSPTVWELVSAAAQRAAGNSSTTPQLAGLFRAYAALDDASQEESLAAGARVADQVHRLSASLCIDGCQACLSGGVDAATSETAVSRLVLAHYSDFIFGSAPDRPTK